MSKVSKISIVIAAYLIAYFTASYFASIYSAFTPVSLGGTYVTPAAAKFIAGLPLGVIALLIFSFTLCNTNRKWIWVAIPIMPAALFFIILDPLHLYVPIILGVVAWGLGVLANKALRKLAPGVMARLT